MDKDFSLTPREFVNKYRTITCPSCKIDVYKYTRDDKIEPYTVMMAEHFKSLHKDVPDPKGGDKLECPFCHSPMILQGRLTER